MNNHNSKAAGISAGLAARWFPHIDAAMKEFGITAPLDQAMFIAQMGMSQRLYPAGGKSELCSR
jgi:predicted chitinase